MLAIVRALMACPRLLLIDEPSLGLAPRMVGRIWEVIKEINVQDTTVLLIEQNATSALAVASHAFVLTVGAVTLPGLLKAMRGLSTVDTGGLIAPLDYSKAGEIPARQFYALPPPTPR